MEAASPCNIRLEIKQFSCFDFNTCCFSVFRYALGDNAEWAKQTNFEHATHIPFMISVPGLAPGVSHALVEEIDLYPTLVEAATMHVEGGPLLVPHCPTDTMASRATAGCTEGFSLMPLIKNASTQWGKAAFSQFTRKGSCCDCPTPAPKGSDGVCCNCFPTDNGNDSIMGYTVRVDRYRYTGWFAFNATQAAPDFTRVAGLELYEHIEDPLPVDWAVEHTNVVHADGYKDIAARLHTILIQCAQRPDLCPPDLLAGLVP